jgi:hypothetical protein
MTSKQHVILELVPKRLSKQFEDYSLHLNSFAFPVFSIVILARLIHIFHLYF